MAAILWRRLVQGLSTIFIVVTIAFLLGRMSGSPAALLLSDTATTEQIEALNAQLGFDRPLWQQYVDYMAGVLTGDFGDSYRQSGVSSMELVLERLPASILLGSVGLVLGVLIATVAAVCIQLTGSRSLRTALLGVGSARQAIPDFFFGLLLGPVAVALGARSIRRGERQLGWWAIAAGLTGFILSLVVLILLATGQLDQLREALERANNER